MQPKTCFEHSPKTNRHTSVSTTGAGGRYVMSVLTPGDDRHIEIFNPTIFVGKGFATIFEMPLETVLKDWIKDELSYHTVPKEHECLEDPREARSHARTSPVVFDSVAHRRVYAETIDQILAFLDEIKTFTNALRYDDPELPKPIFHSDLKGLSFALAVHEQILANGDLKLAAAFLKDLPTKPTQKAANATWNRYNADCERIARAYVQMMRWRFEYRQAVRKAKEGERLQ